MLVSILVQRYNLFTMLNWLSTMLLAKQAAKFVPTRLNALSRWHIVPSVHYTILEVDTVSPVNIEYFTAEYCSTGFPLSDFK